MRSTTNHAQRLITLWIGWLLSMLFQVDLGLMPLFHGQSPEINSQVPRLDQIVLMAVMTLLGLLINIEVWHWWRQHH
jgi:hypothetical protein